MIIACDESGSEGEKLIGGETDVFAHASVRLSTEAAARCVQRTRERIRSPAVEYKANHLLREKNRPVLEWLLGPSGPVHGNALVQLVDKKLFLVGKIVELLGDPADPVTVHRDGRRAFGRERWEALLASFNDLMRVRNRRGVTSVDAFFDMVDALRPIATLDSALEFVELLGRARPRVESVRARLLDDARMPALDPLIPAIVRAAAYWSADGRPVSIVHDEHLSLTDARIARLEHSGLVSLTLVDSQSDARVQVADFIAGVARKIASDELNGRGDAALIALLRPYVDSSSIWAG